MTGAATIVRYRPIPLFDCHPGIFACTHVLQALL